MGVETDPRVRCDEGLSEQKWSQTVLLANLRYVCLECKWYYFQSCAAHADPCVAGSQAG